MAIFVRACMESDLDQVAATCTHEMWIPQPALIPDLSVEDAQIIGAKIAILWAIAFGVRVLRKQIQRS